MTINDKKNFKWLAQDIDATLILKVISTQNNSEAVNGVFNVSAVLETTGDKLEVETANIDDLTNLLTLGIVRFVNVADPRDILDIPFRNLYKLYGNANVLGNTSSEKLTSFDELEVFSVIDDEMRNDCLIFSALIGDVTEDLNEVMTIASIFEKLGMQAKFDALSRVNLINHRRLIADKK